MCLKEDNNVLVTAFIVISDIQATYGLEGE